MNKEDANLDGRKEPSPLTQLALDVAKESDTQEKERKSMLLTKADNALKICSFLLTSFNALAVWFKVGTERPLSFWLTIIWLLFIAPLLFGLYCSLRAQRTKDKKVFPGGGKFIDFIANGKDANLDQSTRQVITLYDTCTKTLTKGNDCMAKDVQRVHNCIVFSLVVFTIFLGMLLAG